MKVLELMTSRGRTRSETTESDSHRLGLMEDGWMERFRDVSKKVLEPMTCSEAKASCAFSGTPRSGTRW